MTKIVHDEIERRKARYRQKQQSDLSLVLSSKHQTVWYLLVQTV
jgi:hypothetical protein